MSRDLSAAAETKGPPMLKVLITTIVPGKTEQRSSSNVFTWAGSDFKTRNN